MTARSLFNIILKIFGLLFLREIIYTIPQFASTLLDFTSTRDFTGSIFMLVIVLVFIGFYCFCVFQLLFKTNFFIDKLKLDKGFEEETFSLNIPATSVINLGVIITGSIILIEEIPNLFRHVFVYLQEKNITHGMVKYNFSYMILSAVKILLALLIIGERKRIVAFIENRKQNKEAEPEQF
jgi:hypothetical protein